MKNTWIPEPIKFDCYAKLLADTKKSAIGRVERAITGKALFLDTMGFASTSVMGGDPTAPDLDEVSGTYSERLRPRHAVLAWLALEGVFPALLTTNYDLLLEGAYRLAGMEPLMPDTEGNERTGAGRWQTGLP